MAFSPVRVGPAQLTNSNATLYTNTNDAGAILRSVELHNTSSAACWYSLAFNGTGATAANCWRYQKVLAPGEAVSLSVNIPLADNDTIQGLAQTTSVVNYTLGIVLL